MIVYTGVMDELKSVCADQRAKLSTSVLSGSDGAVVVLIVVVVVVVDVEVLAVVTD